MCSWDHVSAGLFLMVFVTWAFKTQFTHSRHWGGAGVLVVTFQLVATISLSRSQHRAAGVQPTLPLPGVWGLRVQEERRGGVGVGWWQLYPSPVSPNQGMVYRGSVFGRIQKESRLSRTRGESIPAGSLTRVK